MNAEGSRGRSPLHYVCGLIKLPRSYDPASYGARVFEMLVAAGAEVNATDWHGSSPLHFAVRNDSIWVVRRIVKLGADVTAEDDDGYTPLHMAASF